MCPVLISMDMLSVDPSALPNVNIGSTVTLRGENLPVEEFAQAAYLTQTIRFEKTKKDRLRQTSVPTREVPRHLNTCVPASILL